MQIIAKLWIPLLVILLLIGWGSKNELKVDGGVQHIDAQIVDQYGKQFLSVYLRG